MQAYHSDEITHEGRTFEALLYADDDQSPPWEREDGHGEVRHVWCYGSRPEKRPGEILMHSNRGDHWFYDFAGAMRVARKEWGLCDSELAKLRASIGREPTKGEIARAAVLSDMRHLRGWLRDDWCYVGVCVRILGPDGEPIGDQFDHAIWGVESEGDYWREVAQELAGEIMAERAEAWRAALKERREARYWASRDIRTAA